MNVIYLGAINGGLSRLINKTKFEKVLGGKKDLKLSKKRWKN